MELDFLPLLRSMDDARRLIIRHSPHLLRYYQVRKVIIPNIDLTLLSNGCFASRLQLYVAGYDVAALRETLSTELAKINDPHIESHPAHVAWKSLDDVIANEFLQVEEEEARIMPERVTASLAKRLKMECLRLQDYVALTVKGNQGGFQHQGPVIQVDDGNFIL